MQVVEARSSEAGRAMQSTSSGAEHGWCGHSVPCGAQLLRAVCAAVNAEVCAEVEPGGAVDARCGGAQTSRTACGAVDAKMCAKWSQVVRSMQVASLVAKRSRYRAD